MRQSLRLLATVPRITLFTSPRCSLCDTAKAVVHKVKTRRPFELVTIDVREEGQQQWFDKYAFDTPVIHVDRTTANVEDTLASQKLMHRFTENQVEELLDNVETN